jgi:hypothetical protein
VVKDLEDFNVKFFLGSELMGRKKATNTENEDVPVEIKNINSKPKDIKPKFYQSEPIKERKPSSTLKKKKLEKTELLSKTTKKDKTSNDGILKRIIKIEKTLEKVSKQLDSLLKTQKNNKNNKNEKKPKEINNTVGGLDSKKNITPKLNKRKSPNAKKEDVNISFAFKMFFKKTDDEKSMKEKSQKISNYIHSYLGSQAFLKKYGLSNDANETVKKGTKNTLPVHLDTILSIEKRECVLRFTANPLKNTGTTISEKTIGSIVESVQDKLFYAEESGWCEGVVYDVGG